MEESQVAFGQFFVPLFTKESIFIDFGNETLFQFALTLTLHSKPKFA